MSLAQTIASRVRAGLELIKVLQPIADELGVGEITTKVRTIATTVTEIVDNVLTRVDEGALVMSSEDADVIRELAQQLADINDALAAAIAES